MPYLRRLISWRTHYAINHLMIVDMCNLLRDGKSPMVETLDTRDHIYGGRDIPHEAKRWNNDQRHLNHEGPEVRFGGSCPLTSFFLEGGLATWLY